MRDTQQGEVPVGIGVAWDQADPRIVVAVFEGRWTLREFEAAGAQVMALAGTTARPVGAILDVSAASLLPQGFIDRAADVAQAAGSQPGSNVVVYTVVGAPPVVQAMYHAFFRVFGCPEVRQRVLLVESTAAARQLIAARLGAYAATGCE